METSGASDEIGNLSSICQRLQEAIKIYDDKVREAKKEENERIERKRTLMLNFIAIFAIVSAFKDGADLIISSIDSFMDDSLPIALKSIKFALYLFAIFWLYPILKKLITCLNSTNNEDNLTRGFVMQKAKQRNFRIDSHFIIGNGRYSRPLSNAMQFYQFNGRTV